MRTDIRQRAARVKNGMTRAEVERLFHDLGRDGGILELGHNRYCAFGMTVQVPFASADPLRPAASDRVNGPVQVQVSQCSLD